MTAPYLAQALLTFLPPSVARSVCSRRITEGGPLQGVFPAAVLFSDISGFTVLTGKLAEHGSAGAEELTILLNRYFTRMIDLLAGEGGEVVQFSGDAMMVVFPCDEEVQLGQAVQRALRAGQQMQQAQQDQFARLHTSVGDVELGMKVSIGAGQVYEYTLGGAGERWYYLIAGDPLSQVAEAEHHASRGEVVLSPEARALLSGPVAPARSKAAEPVECPEIPADILAAIRSYAPEVITNRLEAGQSEWLAEIRRLTVLFLNVQGLQYGSESALEQVQDWMLILQQTVYHCGGTLNKLLVDDKGTIGIALFGAPPLSHEDDPLRAVRCAMDLKHTADARQLQINIGLTTGRVFAGPVGSPRRREYTVMGDTVNLSARLMQSAAKAGGGIRSDADTYQASRANIEWEELPPERMKGFAAPVPVFRAVALSQAGQGNPLRPRSFIIGREREFERLAQWTDQALSGHLQVVMIDSEPGQGRGPLLTELLYRLHEQSIATWFDRGDPLEQQTPYSAWNGIFRSYFGIQSMALEGRCERVWARLVEISREQSAPNLLERAPLLNDLLGLDLPESDLTANLSARFRQASLEALLVDLIAHRLEKGPLLIALEEVQWLDSLSWQLIVQVARALADSKLIIVLTAQALQDLPEDHPWTQMQALRQFHRMTLAPLADEDIIRFCEAVLGVNHFPAELVRLIVSRAAGSPIVAEQITAALCSSGILQVNDGACEIVGDLNEASVPDTLHGLVLHKIDQLEASQQLALKVAAVIGRTFGSRTLQDIYPLPIEHSQLLQTLDRLAEKGLVQPLVDNIQLHSHAFRQAIYQEVTYQTVLPSQSRELHAQIALWYETYTSQAGEQSGLYPLLAYHWRRALNGERELFFSTKASRKLFADYANHEALSFLDRALQLETDPAQQYELFDLRLKVHDRLGNRVAQREDLQHLQHLIDTCPPLEARQTSLANDWAEYFRSQAQYGEAQEALRRALAFAHQAGDRASEARSLTLWGKVLEHMSLFHEARGYFVQALEISRQTGSRLGEAENLSRLSSIARSLGEMGAAREAEQQALLLRRGLGDRAGEATSLINLALIAQALGESETAWNHRQEALVLARAIGDRAAEAFNMSTIGLGYLMRGDYVRAQDSLKQALRLHRVMGNRSREAECQNVLGMMWRDVGDFEQARACLEEAVDIQEAIHDPNSAAYTYLNLGYLLLDSNHPLAQQYFERALKYATETGSREAEAYANAYLAFASERVGDWEAARRYYNVALPIWRELQALAAEIEDLAGLARIAYARGEHQPALQHAETCWTHLQARGVDGMEFPILVYLTCHDIFLANGRPDIARQIITAAHELLVSRAGLIHDPVFRDGMLHRVPENRRVLKLLEQSL